MPYTNQEKKRSQERANYRRRRGSESESERKTRCKRQAKYMKSWRSRATPEMLASMRRTRFIGHLKHSYGITADEYDRLVISSCGRCDACGEVVSNKRDGLSLDHDHTTGRARGMLCGHCNKALGYLRDSPLLAAKLAAYAARFRK